MIFKSYKKKVMGNIFCFLMMLFLCNTNIIAQQTNNLQVIWEKTGDSTFFGYGFLSTSPGDVNGDGYDDILYYGNERSWAGKAFLFYGSNNIDTIPDVVLSYSNGYTAVCMGNFNADEFDDVVLGNVLDFSDSGSVKIFLGGNPIDTIFDFILKGREVGSGVGGAVASGNVNGDGYDDLIVGACGAAPMPGGYDYGQVYIYYGGPNFDMVPEVILNGGHMGVREFFGSHVNSGGDVNADGFDDIIIGAYGFNNNRGRIYIYLGGNPMDSIYDITMTGESYLSGLGERALGLLKNENYYDHAFAGAPGYFQLGKVYVLYGGNPMDSIPDLIMTGSSSAGTFGVASASAGNVDASGYAGLIAGAPMEDTGKVYLWQGGVHFDTVPDGWMRGTQTISGIGWDVACAGDVDGDGKDEIMVSNYASDYSPKRVWVCKYTGTGVEEIASPRLAMTSNVEVYPNPVKSVLRVRCPFAVKEMKIYDITGKTVKVIETRSKKQEARETEIRWDLRDENNRRVANGIYFVELVAEQGKEKIREIRKIVVTK